MHHKILKYFAIVLASFSLLACGGLWYVQSHASSWSKNYAHQIGESIGYLIDFDDLKVSIPDLRLEVDHLKMVELANQRELLSIQHIEVQGAWAGLFHKKIELKSITIDDPQILAEKYRNNWNWIRFIQSIKEKFPPKPKQQPKKLMEFKIDQLILTGGNLRVVDPEMHFDTGFTSFSIELLQTTNIDSKGELGGLETKYSIDLGDVTLPIPNQEQKLHLGHVILGGDFDLDENKDMALLMKAKIGNGLIDSTTHFHQAENKIVSEIGLEKFSLIPFIDFVTPKISRDQKTGTATGRFNVMHQAKKIVIDGDVGVDDVSIVPFISLIPTINSIYAKSGGADGHFKIHYDPALTQVSGDIHLNNLGVFETDKTSELIGWDGAKLNHFDFERNTVGQKLNIDQVTIDALKGRFVIYSDRSSNFRRMFKPASDQTNPLGQDRQNLPAEKLEEKKSNIFPEGSQTISAAPFFRKVVTQVAEQISKDPPSNLAEIKNSSTKGKKAFNFNVKSVEVTSGKIEFSDFSVRPNFHADIHNFHGTLIGIDNTPKRYATSAFEGLVAPEGDMKMKGQIAFADAKRNNDVNLSFRRVPLKSINPYATHFMGYEIKSGTMSYDSHYVTKEGDLTGDNHIVINQMVLGDKVPDYKGKNIPLELIIALLEDENGVMDLNLKVAGNVDKPKFMISDLIWEAVGTILTNIVSSPFKMIGRLMGIEDFSGVYFEPGKSVLRPSESLKLETLSGAMLKRPKAKIKILGVFDPEVDKLRLNTDRIDREIFKNAGFKLQANEPLPELPLADERVQKVIRNMYSASGLAPKTDHQLARGVAGIEDWRVLHDGLVANGTVSDEELSKLATARAQSILAELLKINPDLGSRLSIIDSKTVSASKDGIPAGIEIIAN
jgi:hypothetical protein